MQEGMRMKSKDITFFEFTFYLAINFFIDIFIIAKKLFKFNIFSIHLVYLVTFKN